MSLTTVALGQPGGAVITGFELDEPALDPFVEDDAGDFPPFLGVGDDVTGIMLCGCSDSHCTAVRLILKILKEEEEDNIFCKHKLHVHYVHNLHVHVSYYSNPDLACIMRYNDKCVMYTQ